MGVVTADNTGDPKFVTRAGMGTEAAPMDDGNDVAIATGNGSTPRLRVVFEPGETVWVEESVPTREKGGTAGNDVVGGSRSFTNVVSV